MIRLFVLALSLAACGPYNGPAGDASALSGRAQARATIRLLIDGTALADELCAKSDDPPTLRRCRDAYRIAAPTLHAAGDVVDLYDVGKAGEVRCAVQRGATAAREMVSALNMAAVQAPPILVDGLELFERFLAGGCSEKDGGTNG